MSGTTFRHFIDNRFVPSGSERQFEKYSPVDGSLVGTVAEGGQEEVNLAVQAASGALQGPWGQRPAARVPEKQLHRPAARLGLITVRGGQPPSSIVASGS